jgi:hypothetical protein
LRSRQGNWQRRGKPVEDIKLNVRKILDTIQEKSIKVLGKVVSCVLIKESDYAHYDIGIEFLGMLEKNRDILKDVMCLLENMGFIAV